MTLLNRYRYRVGGVMLESAVDKPTVLCTVASLRKLESPNPKQQPNHLENNRQLFVYFTYLTTPMK
jgi:hypothetical protein